MPVSLDCQPFGTIPPDESVYLYTLSNRNGMQVKITNYGGIVTSVQVPDKKGIPGEINLGFIQLSNYLKPHPYFGAIIGRYGNRIANAQFSLEHKSYQLTKNDAINHLHGGARGFDKVLWTPSTFTKDKSAGLILKYLSVDGEEGFPGNLSCQVTYQLTEENELEINYFATTDKVGVINLTNHCYFNLKDGGNSSCLQHEISIYADHFTPVDKNMIPTGEILPVKNSPFDFLSPKEIGRDIEKNNGQLILGNGYDHNFVLNQKQTFKKAARVYERESDRIMEVFTSEPGIQFYTANWLDGTLTGHGGRNYQKRNAFCLETQHFPDTPNQNHFPSTLILPGVPYESKTTYKFSVESDS